MGKPWIYAWFWLALPLAFALGILAQRQGIPGSVRLFFFAGAGTHSRMVEQPTWRDPVVLLVAGQSNAANHGRPRGRAGSGSYALSVEGVFRLEDPLPGASGPGGSPWPPWAALQQRARPGTQVVVAAIAQGSSAVADWIPGGVHAQRLPEVLKALRRQQLAVDAVVWHQGETEAWSGGDAAAYEANLRRWIASVREQGINAPIFVCLTSRDGQGVINPAIRQAQSSVWNAQVNVFAGPDTDSLGDAFRSDGVHFNARGLEAFASLLQRAMETPSSQRATRLEDLQLSAHP
jgi:lysophospholipase L1-like esterase